MISAAFPYQKQLRRVLGSDMAYVEVGEGDPIVLLEQGVEVAAVQRPTIPALFSMKSD
jgi:haloalkane dehalogenase